MHTELERTEAFTAIIDKLRETYADAKRLHIDMSYEWQEADDMEPELCPKISIGIER